MSNKLAALDAIEPLVDELYYLEGSTDDLPHIYKNECDNGRFKPAPHIIYEYVPYARDIDQVIRELQADIGALDLRLLSDGSSLHEEQIAEYLDDIEQKMIMLRGRYDIIASWLRRDDDDNDDGPFPEPYHPIDPFARRPTPSPTPITSA